MNQNDNRQEMEAELLDCPFCGGRVEMNDWTDYKSVTYPSPTGENEITKSTKYLSVRCKCGVELSTTYNAIADCEPKLKASFFCDEEEMEDHYKKRDWYKNEYIPAKKKELIVKWNRRASIKETK